MYNFFLDNFININWFFYNMFNWYLNFTFDDTFDRNWLFNDIFDKNWFFNEYFDISVNNILMRNFDFLSDDFFYLNWSGYYLLDFFFYQYLFGYFNVSFSWNSNIFSNDVILINRSVYVLIL